MGDNLIQSILDDIGVKDQGARSAAVKYGEQLLADGLDPDSLQGDLGAFTDGYLAAKEG